jgi:hypothetical protein
MTILVDDIADFVSARKELTSVLQHHARPGADGLRAWRTTDHPAHNQSFEITDPVIEDSVIGARGLHGHYTEHSVGLSSKPTVCTGSGPETTGLRAMTLPDAVELTVSHSRKS